MSHKTEVETQFLDIDMVKKTAEELGYTFEHHKGDLALFNGQVVENAVAKVKIPGWNYPIGIRADGTAGFDNFNGSWGDEKQFDAFRQQYALNVTVDQAQRNGYRVLHQSVDGSGVRRLHLGK
jgi:hypothetical protein